MLGMVRFGKTYRERVCPAIWGSCPALRVPVRYCKIVRFIGAVDVPALCSLFSSLANQNKWGNGFPPGPAPGIPVSATL
eukprot:1140944-Pelagomonas_calceolata.AAC.1